MDLENYLQEWQKEMITYLDFEVAKFAAKVEGILLSEAINIISIGDSYGPKIASGAHRSMLKSEVKLIGETQTGIYLFSDVTYDRYILAGSRYTSKKPPAWKVNGEWFTVFMYWIAMKQRKTGAFAHVNIHNQKELRRAGFAVREAIWKRKTHATLPFNYVGMAVKAKETDILNLFNGIGKS